MKRKNKCTWHAEVHVWLGSVCYIYTGIYSLFLQRKTIWYRSQEHRQLRLEDITIENNATIVYRENTSKTFHGGIADMKNEKVESLSTFATIMKMIVMSVA
jgi:hypothetical protein